MSKMPSAQTRLRKTMMFDALTREKIMELRNGMDIDQTDVCIRAINIMYALNQETAAGKMLYFKSVVNEPKPLKFEYLENNIDESKVTLQFNQVTLDKAEKLSQSMNIYLTYVFRQAIALMHFIHNEMKAGFTVMMVDNETQEVETIRFF